MAARYRFLHLALFPLLLFLVSSACVLSKNNSSSNLTGQGVQSGQAGFTRQTPIPLGTLLSIPGWDIQVLELLRGADALKEINTEYWSAPPLQDGQEYVLAKVFIRSTSLADDYQDIGITEMFITGEKCLAYGDTLDGWPQPEFLYEDIYTAEAVEGWVDAVVSTDEENLELVLDIMVDGVRYTRFFELDKGASIELPAEKSALQENNLGLDAANPAVVGDQVISADWSLTVLETLRGQDAQAVLEKGYYYTPPQSGQEYLLLHIDLQYVSREEAPSPVGFGMFYAKDDEGNMLPSQYFYTPDDRIWLSGIVLPGAQIDAWVAMNIPEGNDPATIVFDPDRYGMGSADGNTRYIRIE